MAGHKRIAASIELPTREHLLRIIQKINSQNPTRDKALLALNYLTGARVSELLSIKRKQIEKVSKADVEFLIIHNVKVLKRRKDIHRTILIPVKKEKDFLLLALEHINKTGDEEKLFDITRQRAWQITKNKTGYFNHFFRHLRTTHLVTDYNFSAHELQKFFGWASSKMADAYAHLDVEDIARKMALSVTPEVTKSA